MPPIATYATLNAGSVVGPSSPPNVVLDGQVYRAVVVHRANPPDAQAPYVPCTEDTYAGRAPTLTEQFVRRAAATTQQAIRDYESRIFMGKAWFGANDELWGTFHQWAQFVVNYPDSVPVWEAFEELKLDGTLWLRSPKQHARDWFEGDAPALNQHRCSRLYIKVLDLWAKAVENVACQMRGNANAYALCHFAEHLLSQAQKALRSCESEWARKKEVDFGILRDLLSASKGQNWHASVG